MTNRSTISQSAVRARLDRLDRRRRVRPAAASAETGPTGTAAAPATVDAGSSSPAGSPLLRRWSVAELVARAAARPTPREPLGC
jgi:hypothetical protein